MILRNYLLGNYSTYLVKIYICRGKIFFYIDKNFSPNCGSYFIIKVFINYLLHFHEFLLLMYKGLHPSTEVNWKFCKYSTKNRNNSKSYKSKACCSEVILHPNAK
ncbi:hypothetical protein H8356DRAFT_1085833 [Neocallimastix lanati (nom. inval.)]|nr:hypothetical protein H8356DRAFT_1085833 [Neocallimastix sp. JGI-2020a]